MSLFDKCKNFTRVEELKRKGAYPYFSPIASSQEPEILIDGKKMLMLGSNSYLGLTTHPKVVEAAINAIKRFGSSCSGSRFLNGTLEIHQELEERLAKFMGKEKALVFTTGFQVNLGVISTLIGKDDVVITDKTDHASIIDGARLSFGKMYRFNHNSSEDLERVLINGNGNGNANGSSNGRLIIVDGVFSMDGDIADLPALTKVAKEYDTRVMVDDAHGIGCLGPKGDGTAAHFNLSDEVDLIMGTFSKAFASTGGFIAGKEEVIDFIQHYARAFIFSASLSPSQVAAALASLNIIENEPERREKLWKNTHFLKDGLTNLGFNTGKSETPIIPVIVGEDLKCFLMWRALREEGVFVNPIISPAVPPGESLIRISIMATHSEEQLSRGLKIIEKVGKQQGVI